MQDGTVTAPGLQLNRKEFEAHQKVIDNAVVEQTPPFKKIQASTYVKLASLRQLFGNILIDFFDVTTGSGNKCKVTRIIVCPSQSTIHLGTKSDIKLKTRSIESTTPVDLKIFIDDLTPTVKEARLYIAAAAADDGCKEPNIGFVKEAEWPLWHLAPAEGTMVENKEPTCDVTTAAKTFLITYAPPWLDAEGGTLRLGVQNQPQLATGVWLQDVNTKKHLAHVLTDRFKLRFDHTSFCFPSAVKSLSLGYHPLQAKLDDLWVNEDGKLVVIWVEAPRDDQTGFPAADARRRELHRCWVKSLKADKDLYGLFKPADRPPLKPPLLLPLRMSIVGLAVPRPATTGLMVFPCAISRPAKWSATLTDRMVELLRNNDVLVSSEMVELVGDDPACNLLDEHYCVLDITVRPSTHQPIKHMCQLPVMWSLTETKRSARHCGNAPTRMNFDELLLKLDTNEAELRHLKAVFNRRGTRPILVTNISGNENAVKTNCIGAIARTPWTLVVDFDFSETPSALLRSEGKSGQEVFLPDRRLDP